MEIFATVVAPLIGAVSCIRIFPMSVRKFSTIIILWLFLMVCAMLARFIPVITPRAFEPLLLEYSTDFISGMLSIFGVVFGMLLLPVTYFSLVLVRRLGKHHGD